MAVVYLYRSLFLVFFSFRLFTLHVMASVKENINCILWLAELMRYSTVTRTFHLASPHSQNCSPWISSPIRHWISVSCNEPSSDRWIAFQTLPGRPHDLLVYRSHFSVGWVVWNQSTQDRKCTCDVTMWRIPVTTVAIEKINNTFLLLLV